MIENVLQTVFAFILVLAPLVFIHEFGHFIVAKLFGIGVPVFSLGFGPRLFGFRRAETDYRVSLIPLGGYVRLAGDEADENRTGSPDEFLSRPKYQRFFVFVAGAVFNIILAFFAFWLLFGLYGREVVPEVHPTVRNVAEGSEAERAGIRRGDQVLSISGKDVKAGGFLNTYSLEVTLAPGTDKEIVVDRDGQRLSLLMNTGADPKFGHGSPGWVLAFGGGKPPVIDRPFDDSPAQAAGLQPGDTILAAAGQEPINLLEFQLLIETSAGREVEIKVDRGGRQLPLTVVPELEQGRGRIGVQFLPQALEREPLSLGQAARESLRANLTLSKTLFVVLRRLVTAELPLKSMSGPIGIAQVARQAFIAGPDTFLYLLGFFSLQLGILNLLPIPVLDGGHILILGVESVMRRDLSDRIKERVMQAGFVFLLAFMGIIIYLDVMKSL